MGSQGYDNYWNYKPEVDYVTVAALGRNGRILEGFSLKTKKLMEEKKRHWISRCKFPVFICIVLTGWKLLQILFYIFEVWPMLVLMLILRPIILPLCRQFISMLPQERLLRSLHFLQHVDFFPKRSQELLLNCNLCQYGWDSCNLKS